jgi:very-short-patch-repair endonuclease
MVRESWGYSGFEEQGRIDLAGCSIPYTKPDLLHPDAQIAIYLDGAPHFSYNAFRKDAKIKRALQLLGWLVIRIPIGDFENAAMMARHREDIEERLKPLDP